MTPQNGPRLSNDDWRDVLEEKMNGQHERVNKSLDMLFGKFDAIAGHYVTKESLKYQLDNIEDRYEPFRTSMVWLMRMIVGGFVAALAQYVYVHTK